MKVQVVAVGKATRLVEYVQRMRKTYEAEFLLGRTSETDDIEGRVVETVGVSEPSDARVRTALEQYVGTIEQVPPDYSAVKVEGRRAYKSARLGKDVQLAPRPVEIFSLDLIEYRYPLLRVRMTCGSGTYVRSVARDLGRDLRTGGLMARLTRTAIGRFTLAESAPIESLEDERWRAFALDVRVGLAELPALVVESADADRFLNGQTLRIDHHLPGAGDVAVFAAEDRLLGIGRVDAVGEAIRPAKGGFVNQRPPAPE